jgi:F0F1-type ATP synthase assembly protein I
MTEGPGAKDAPPTFTDKERAPGQDALSGMTELERRETLAWVGEHLPLVRQSVSGQRILYSTLVTAFVVGLAAYVGGYLLKASVTTEPLGLVADLLYALGYALWTGVVVVAFVQVFPEVKRRQYKQALDAYEATRRERARAGSDQASGDDAAPTAR